MPKDILMGAWYEVSAFPMKVEIDPSRFEVTRSGMPSPLQSSVAMPFEPFAPVNKVLFVIGGGGVPIGGSPPRCGMANGAGIAGTFTVTIARIGWFLAVQSGSVALGFVSKPPVALQEPVIVAVPENPSVDPTPIVKVTSSPVPVEELMNKGKSTEVMSALTIQCSGVGVRRWRTVIVPPALLLIVMGNPAAGTGLP